VPTLRWLTRDDDLNAASRAKYRLLQEVPELGGGDKDNSENMIIQGDNLEALKALLPFYAGQVKCIYIDPPYNTGAAFEHYDDNLKHTIWLSIMYSRLEILRELLSKDGFLCCHIDDSEGHYLKILLDEVFGREKKYQTTFYVRVRYPEKTLKEDMYYHKEIEQVHIYRKEYGAIPNFSSEVVGFDKFCYYITNNDVCEQITLGGKRVDIFQKGQYSIEKREGSEFGLKEIWASGTILDGNSSGRFFRDYLTGRKDIDGLGVLYKVWGIGDDRFDFRYFTGPQRKTATKGKYYQGVPIEKLNAKEVTKKVAINNFYDFAGSFGNCRSEGGVDFRGGKKPEALLELILKYFSKPGDLVLDSFLGSGTTAAVAHKMRRRYIGIECEDQAKTHCAVRLKRVIDGELSGISQNVDWNGGGGFRFYTLGDPIFDSDGRISSTITFEQLAAHIWFYETKTPFNQPKVKTAFLGAYNNIAYALLYNGILCDKSVNGGNVLTSKTLTKILDDADGTEYSKLVVYAASSRIGAERLKENGIVFKQTPYDVRIK